MLRVEHITTGYGKKQVLTDVSFEVKQGEIVFLSGGNGSGKSTVLKTIYGLLKPWDENGKIIFDRNDITGLQPCEMIKRGIVYMPQKKNVFEDFTVEENLLTSGSIYSMTNAMSRIEKVFETIPQLASLRKRTPFHMSGGEKQLLAFGNVLVHSPQLIMLDEPFAGIDSDNYFIFKNKIIELNNAAVTFLIVEHKKYLFDTYNCREIELKLGVKKEIV